MAVTSRAKRPRSPGPQAARHPQAACFRRTSTSSAAIKHSVPHRVVSQVICPEMAAFLANDRVMTRSHHDELCCVDTVKCSANGLKLDAACLEYLLQFPHLTRLQLKNTAIDADGLGEVAKLSQLQHLDLSECHSVDAMGLAEVGKLAQLQHLDLNYCSKVDAAGLAEVGKCSGLRHLELICCCGVDTVGLAAVGQLPMLQHLDLRWCDGVDAAGLAAVGKLSLGNCDGVDVVGLEEVAKLPQLQHLDLSRCGVDARGLAAIAQLPQLKHLDLRWCEGVDTATLGAVEHLRAIQCVLTTPTDRWP